MTEQEVVNLFNEAGALISDSHVVYASGRHGSAYLNKDALFARPDFVDRCGRDMAVEFRERPNRAQIVVGPTIGGALLAQWVAYNMDYGMSGKAPRVMAAYAEKTSAVENGFVLRRGYDKLVCGRRVLVVEDVLTTGESAKKTVEAVRAAGGDVMGVAALWNRGGVTMDEVGRVPVLFSLVNRKLASWSNEACPLCEAEIPINTEVGHVAKFLAARR